jgi:DNA-binding GntR family transcriptional regulator
MAMDERQSGTPRTLETHRKNVAHLGRAADIVREALREAILSGDLAPGTRLREEDIARQFGVSRTPVREALQQLRSDELVELHPNLGATVIRLSIEDTLAIYLVRESLEGLSARLAALRATPDDHMLLYRIIEEMETAIESQAKPGELSILNLRFHAELRRIANNRYLDRFLGQVEHAVHRFGETTFAYPGRRDASVAEHRAIVDAIAQGDPERAEELAVKHMREARQIRIVMLAEGRM